MTDQPLYSHIFISFPPIFSCIFPYLSFLLLLFSHSDLAFDKEQQNMVFAALKVLVFGVPRQGTRTQTTIEQNVDHTGKSSLVKNHAEISIFASVQRLTLRLERDLHSISLSHVNSEEILDVESQDYLIEKRFKVNPRMVSDAIIGLSDGLTVPFALTAGLSSLASTRYVVLGGLAELVAGAISMGLGGFIGAKSEA